MLAHELCGGWFLFEIIAPMNIFNYAFVFVLHIFYLLLQVLEFAVEGFDLLHSATVAAVAYWLRHGGVRGV
jgi:hypothetical protein